AERRLSFSLCSCGLVTAHVQPCPCLRECRKPRSLTIKIALAGPRFGFSATCCIEGRLRCLQRLALGLDVASRAFELGVDLPKPVSRREAPRGTSRGMRGCDVAVPAP